MSSVRNFLRKQTDVNHSSTPHVISSKISELERPLSEYDNLTAAQTHFDIKFRFDDLPTIMSNPSSYNINNNNNSQPIQSNTPQYENVLETIQMRNKRESDQQVKINQNDGHSPQRSVISDAKSTFFGLTHPLHQQSNNDDLNELISDDDKLDGTIIVSNRKNEYVNVMPNEPMEDPNKNPLNHDKVSATSSASGSSSTTVTPSSSPTRNDRKNSEGSNRSKSPKFTLPEISDISTPSQAVYMATTVPQNIKGQNIMGRHKPTRNSLRHSRMIVTSKHFQGASSNYLNIRHVWLAKFVLILKIVIGTSLLALGAWICLFANSTPISQNPFWSGLIIIISGLLGLYLLSFKRTHRSSKLKANFFWFLKMNASIIIVMSVFLTTLAFIYASFHFISLKSDNKKCFPENIFINSSSCICVFNVKPDSPVMISRDNGSDAYQNHLDSSGHIDMPDGGNIVHFRDLSCNELDTWTHILLTSMILNFIGLVLAVCYMTQFIFGCKRRRKRSYVSVRSVA